MRIARFLTADGQVATGQMVTDDTARPLRGPLFVTAHAGAASFSVLEFDFQPVRVQRLLPPVEPPNIFAIGRNYRAHAAETGSALPEKPMIFQKPTTALIGPNETIRIPAAAPDEVDYEAELVVVIGRRARRVTPEQALEHVLGFTCANDVSARDCQRSDKQWARAKGFDTFCPLGPWIVTPDEVDCTALRVRSRLNGQVMQDASTRDMVFSCAQLVSYVSHQFTLLPGTLLLTGTPEGVGTARQPPVYLKPGDRIEVDIEGIGILANSVAPELI
jgi:2-keto-4-pentenoate hydratase/2-oxohepta-3-ene-1,7-dioic acid hydratase in catechol pathway